MTVDPRIPTMLGRRTSGLDRPSRHCVPHRGARGGGVCDIMHGGSRMTVDTRVPTMPRRSASGFHRPHKHCLHQARSAVRSGGGGLRRCKPVWVQNPCKLSTIISELEKGFVYRFYYCKQYATLIPSGLCFETWGQRWAERSRSHDVKLCLGLQVRGFAGQAADARFRVDGPPPAPPPPPDSIT